MSKPRYSRAHTPPSPSPPNSHRGDHRSTKPYSSSSDYKAYSERDYQRFDKLDNTKYDKNDDHSKYGKSDIHVKYDKYGKLDNLGKYDKYGKLANANYDKYGKLVDEKYDKYGKIGDDKYGKIDVYDKYGKLPVEKRRKLSGDKYDKYGKEDKYGKLDMYGKLDDKYNNYGKLEDKYDKYRKLDDKYDKYEKLDDKYGKLDKCEKVEDKYGKLDKYEKLDDKYDKYEKVEDKYDKYGKLDKYDKYEKVEDKYGKLDKFDKYGKVEKYDKYEKLDDKYDKYGKLDKYDKYEKLDDKYDKYGKLDDKYGKLDDKYGKLDDKFDKYEKLDDKFDKYEKPDNKYEKLENKYDKNGKLNDDFDKYEKVDKYNKLKLSDPKEHKWDYKSNYDEEKQRKYDKRDYKESYSKLSSDDRYDKNSAAQSTKHSMFGNSDYKDYDKIQKSTKYDKEYLGIERTVSEGKYNKENYGRSKHDRFDKNDYDGLGNQKKYAKEDYGKPIKQSSYEKHADYKEGYGKSGKAINYGKELYDDRSYISNKEYSQDTYGLENKQRDHYNNRDSFRDFPHKSKDSYLKLPVSSRDTYASKYTSVKVDGFPSKYSSNDRDFSDHILKKGSGPQREEIPNKYADYQSMKGGNYSKYQQIEEEFSLDEPRYNKYDSYRPKPSIRQSVKSSSRYTEDLPKGPSRRDYSQDEQPHRNSNYERYVIGDSVVYGSPGHNPEDLYTPPVKSKRTHVTSIPLVKRSRSSLDKSYSRYSASPEGLGHLHKSVDGRHQYLHYPKSSLVKRPQTPPALHSISFKKHSRDFTPPHDRGKNDRYESSKNYMNTNSRNRVDSTLRDGGYDDRKIEKLPLLSTPGYNYIPDYHVPRQQSPPKPLLSIPLTESSIPKLSRLNIKETLSISDSRPLLSRYRDRLGGIRGRRPDTRTGMSRGIGRLRNRPLSPRDRNRPDDLRLWIESRKSVGGKLLSGSRPRGGITRSEQLSATVQRARFNEARRRVLEARKQTLRPPLKGKIRPTTLLAKTRSTGDRKPRVSTSIRKRSRSPLSGSGKITKSSNINSKDGESKIKPKMKQSVTSKKITRQRTHLSVRSSRTMTSKSKPLKKVARSSSEFNREERECFEKKENIKLEAKEHSHSPKDFMD